MLKVSVQWCTFFVNCFKDIYVLKKVFKLKYGREVKIYLIWTRWESKGYYDEDGVGNGGERVAVGSAVYFEHVNAPVIQTFHLLQADEICFANGFWSV